MRRPVWLAAGVVIGVGGTLWAEQRVRRAVDRLTPQSMAGEARRSARQLGERVQSAVAAGREARERREDELWASMGGRPDDEPAGPTAGSRGPRHRRTPGRGGGVRGSAAARR